MKLTPEQEALADKGNAGRKPKIGETYFTPYPYSQYYDESPSDIPDYELYLTWVWSNGVFDNLAWEKGIVCLSKWEAIEKARAKLIDWEME